MAENDADGVSAVHFSCRKVKYKSVLRRLLGFELQSGKAFPKILRLTLLFIAGLSKCCQRIIVSFSAGGTRREVSPRGGLPVQRQMMKI